MGCDRSRIRQRPYIAPVPSSPAAGRMLVSRRPRSRNRLLGARSPRPSRAQEQGAADAMVLCDQQRAIPKSLNHRCLPELATGSTSPGQGRRQNRRGLAGMLDAPACCRILTPGCRLQRRPRSDAFRRSAMGGRSGERRARPRSAARELAHARSIHECIARCSGSAATSDHPFRISAHLHDGHDGRHAVARFGVLWAVMELRAGCLAAAQAAAWSAVTRTIAEASAGFTNDHHAERARLPTSYEVRQDLRVGCGPERWVRILGRSSPQGLPSAACKVELQ